jgi:hypothetical protein
MSSAETLRQAMATAPEIPRLLPTEMTAAMAMGTMRILRRQKTAQDQERKTHLRATHSIPSGYT